MYYYTVQKSFKKQNTFYEGDSISRLKSTQVMLFFFKQLYEKFLPSKDYCKKS